MRRPSIALAFAVAALAAAPAAAAGLPSEGFLVFKTTRSSTVVEVRAVGTGHLLATGGVEASASRPADECADRSYAFAAARWASFERYFVNASSAPGHVDRAAALHDIVAAHEAWETPVVTACPRPRSSAYDASFGGLTNRDASLVADLERDGVNAVAFQSLAGTTCDGAIACVVLAFEDSEIREADLAFERRLTRYGFEDYWTTDDETWWDDEGGRWAVSDVATHEFGHFAGLDHVGGSPALTMYTFIHDGAQTLGLGDVLGVAALYPARG